ncbi:hypothetical protein QE152_g32065 [Popillia japonica]|uniref:PHD-type domain-containing protein n=1 Tax=Popillia japonica TaxID=7064 RepID=A0AAW1J0A6_POPJA
MYYHGAILISVQSKYVNFPGLKCNSCSTDYHLKCLGFVEEFKIKDDLQWICQSCREPKEPVVPDKKQCHNELLELLRKTQEDVVAIRDCHKEVVASIQYISHKADDFQGEVNSFKNEMRVVHDRQGKYDILSKELAECRAAIQNLEQYSRMQIIGVPMNRDENVVTIATNIASALGVELVPAEIDTIYRVPRPHAEGSNIQQKPKNIIIRFMSRIKNEFISAAKKKRSLNARDTGFSRIKNEFISAAKKKRSLNARDTGFGSDSRIFIKEHLLI